jgi:hypothetical protein
VNTLKKDKIISGLLVLVGFAMISVAVFLQTEKSLSIDEIDVKSMSASANMYVKDNHYNDDVDMVFEEVDMETTPVAVMILPRTEVYDGLTLEELGAKIDRNLGDGYIGGKGELIASYCIEKGVDPYIATAIILHETGCRAKCSKLVRNCNNVGGMKGSPKCNGGSYRKYDTLEEGINGYLNMLYNNYYSKGLTTPELINPKYATSTTWSVNVNSYINNIKES